MKEISEEAFIDAYNEAQGRTVAQCALSLLGWLEREGYLKVKRED